MDNKYDKILGEYRENDAAGYLTLFSQEEDDAYTKLLLHFDGADGSTTFTDSSSFAHSMTAGGTAALDTAQFKFGVSSGLFDGSGYVTSTDSADWTLGTNDFTIDCWVRISSLPASTSAQVLVSAGQVGGGPYWRFFIYNNAGTYQLAFDNDTSISIFKDFPSLSTGVWTHLAVTRSGSSWMFWQDGVQLGTTAVDATSLGDPGSNFNIGRHDFPAHASFFFDGWMDELRFSNGIARWTAPFTPYTFAYGNIPVVSAISPTSPNRTIAVIIDGIVYYLHAKTTND